MNSKNSNDEFKSWNLRKKIVNGKNSNYEFKP